MTATPAPSPIASPFIVVIGTQVIKSAAPGAQTDPLALPAYELITLPMPDDSSLQIRNYTCPRAEASTQAPVYSYRVVNRYPHDPLAYTQGLIFRDGFLYEGTGLHGASSLRKVSLEDGEIFQRTDLPPQYFGEGITELDGKLYQLTWKENTGFIYEFESFDPLGSFTYLIRGWGLTHDGQRLVMSDGTDQIYFLDPDSLQFTGSLLVSDEFGPLNQINELEYVQGEIWANIFQSSCIARIDPQSGQVTGWIDLDGLLSLAELATANVPNGIAYDPASQRIFITGKYWPNVLEIELSQE
jgi:glutamine cyclotransferase